MYGSKRKRRLHSVAVLLGPLSFGLTILLLEWFFGFKAAAALGTTVWMALWWILRPVNISVTAFVPIGVNALFDLIPMQHVISQYFSEIIVLLFGADLVCLTWATTGLDKRLAIKTLCCIGTSLRQQIAVWLLVATVLSIFLPNVVVCTILVPVAVSMLQFIGEENIKNSKLAVPILLAIVWGAGIGGFGSPLGGAANLVAISYLEKLTGQEFMYIDWVVRFLPLLVLVLLLNLFFLFHLPVPVKRLAGTSEYFKEMYAQLGTIRLGEKISLVLFVAATLLAFIRPLYAGWLPALKPAYVFLIIGLTAFTFEDEDGKLNRSAVELGYSALVVSNFTLYGDTSRGKRPSFIHAAKGELAVPCYEKFLEEMSHQGLKDLQHGEFGADMKIDLVNDGPVTICMDTKNKE